MVGPCEIFLKTAWPDCACVISIKLSRICLLNSGTFSLLSSLIFVIAHLFTCSGCAVSKSNSFFIVINCLTQITFFLLLIFTLKAVSEIMKCSQDLDPVNVNDIIVNTTIYRNRI